MPDQDFERAFATLAHAELAQKAPGLMPYLIGFQVVDKNDDGSRAAGVFGFKVGDQWYYGPVFWMNGKIRGYDLLYIVGQDIFVPMQESWVNYVTNRRPYVMGDGMLDKNLTQMGVMQPDFTIFRRSPLTKGACEKAFKGSYESWCHPASMYCLPTDEKYSGLDRRVNLPVLLTKFSSAHTEALLKAMKGNTKYAEAVYTFYTPSEILSAANYAKNQNGIIKRAEPSEKRLISGNKTKVRVLYGTSNTDPKTMNQLTADEKVKLMKGDVVVDDKRDAKERSEVYKNPEFEKTFQNPGKTGVWSVMTRDGKSADCLVGIHMRTIGQSAVPAHAAIVIDLGDKRYVQCYKQDILARNEIDPMNWDKAFEKLKTPGSLGAGDIGVLVSKDKNIITQPFKVLKSMSNGDGTKTLCVSTDNHIQAANNSFGEVKDDLKPPTQPEICRTMTRYDRVRGGAAYPSCCGNLEFSYNTDACYCDKGQPARSASYDSDSYKKRCRGHHIKLTKKAVGVTTVQDTLIVNQDDVRFIPLKIDDKKSEYSNWGTLDLAGQAELEMALRKMSMTKTAVFFDGNSEFEVTSGQYKQARVSYPKVMQALIVDLGLSETDARLIVKEARTKNKCSVLIKQAGPTPPLLSQEPVSTYDSTYGANVQVPQDQSAMVPSNAPYPNMQESMQPVIDPHAQSMGMSAADQGQKEVFDLSVLSSLIRDSSSTDDKIQEMLKDVILGNDRIGRILFLYYWHNDKFTEKYGDKDLMELEDLLRETFKSVGELVLFLKQKSIEPESVANESVVTL